MDINGLSLNYIFRITFGITALALLLVTTVNSVPVEEWNRTYGVPSYEEGIQARPYSVYLTSDGGYILAGQTNLIKVDINGNQQWKRSFGEIGDYYYIWSVQQTIDGGYVLIGSRYSHSPVGTFSFLIKTDANGDQLWNKNLGEMSVIWGQQTLDGGYVVAGHWGGLIKTDANGNELWKKDLGTNIWYVQQTSDGGYVLGGEGGTLIKTDANGNPLWTRSIGELGYNFCIWSVQQTIDGGYVAVGQTENNFNALIVKTDSNGDQLWSKAFRDPMGIGYDMAYAVQQTTDEGYIIAGRIASDPDRWLQDAWVIKTDVNGIQQWNKTFGWPNKSVGAYSVQQTKDGGYIIAGGTRSQGASGDAWLIKITADTGSLRTGIDTITIGGDTQGQNGQTKSVTVDISGMAGVGALQLDVMYNSAVISVNTVTFGPAAGTGITASNIDNPSGKVTLGVISATGISGTGTLATISFTVAGNAPDATSINIVKKSLKDFNILPVTTEPTITGGTFNVIEQIPPSPVPELSPIILTTSGILGLFFLMVRIQL